MTADFRSLCAELVAAIAKHVPSTGGFSTVYDPAHVELDELLNRAHAVLAEPEPKSELRNNALSPAAYAIVAAAHQQGYTNRLGLAAALQAAADQVVPQGGQFLMTASEDRVRHQLLKIADELKGQDQLTKGSN